MRRYSSIKEAYTRLKEKLVRRKRLVFNRRTGKFTKELIGAAFVVPIDGFMDYYRDRPENVELESAFDEALKVTFKDPTARYAVGFPKVSLNEDGRPPCPLAVQLVLRSRPMAVAYFRSMNVEELPADFAVIARKMFIAFGRGDVSFLVGSLHMEVG
jgi:hypothetical protein